MTNFNYFITAIAGVLCFAIGASAESIGGRPGNEVGDFGEATAGSYVAPKKAGSIDGSIDLNGGQRIKVDAARIHILQWSHELRRDMPNAGLFGTAIHKQNTNDLTGAIADYLEVIKIDDNDPAVHWYLGTAYEAAGKATEAKQESSLLRIAHGPPCIAA